MASTLGNSRPRNVPKLDRLRDKQACDDGIPMVAVAGRERRRKQRVPIMDQIACISGAGSITVFREDALHRVSANVMAQIAKRPANPRVAPA